MDHAVNGICEESLPLELDISRFLQVSCGHIRQILEQQSQLQMIQDDLCKAFPSHLEPGLMMGVDDDIIGDVTVTEAT